MGWWLGNFYACCFILFLLYVSRAETFVPFTNINLMEINWPSIGSSSLVIFSCCQFLFCHISCITSTSTSFLFVLPEMLDPGSTAPLCVIWWQVRVRPTFTWTNSLLLITNCVIVYYINLTLSSFSFFLYVFPFLLLPSIFPSIWVFSIESVVHIRWPKCWSFSFSISPSNEYSGLISFGSDLLAVQY